MVGQHPSVRVGGGQVGQRAGEQVGRQIEGNTDLQDATAGPGVPSDGGDGLFVACQHRTGLTEKGQARLRGHKRCSSPLFPFPDGPARTTGAR